MTQTPPTVLHQGGLPRLSLTLESVLTTLVTSLIRFTLHNANFCSVLIALVVPLVIPSSPPSILSSQTTLIVLLVVSFFAQGCLFAWTVLAGEAPLSGSSFAAQVREIALKSVWLGKGMGLPSLPVPRSNVPPKADSRQQAQPLNVYRTSSAAALASDMASPPLSSGGVAIASTLTDSTKTNTSDKNETAARSIAGLDSATSLPSSTKASSQRLVYMPPSVLNGVLIPGAFVSEDLMRKSRKENTLTAKFKMGLKSLPSLFGPARKSPSTNKSVRSPYARNIQVLGLCCGRMLPKGTREALWVWWNAHGKLQWELLVGALLWLAVGLGAPFVVCKAFSPSLGGDGGVSALALVVVPVLADTLTLAHTVAAFEGPMMGSSTWLSPLPSLFRLVSFSLLAPVIFITSLGLLPTHLHLWSPTLTAFKSSLVAFTGNGGVGLDVSTATSLLLSSWPFAQNWVVYPLISIGNTTGLLFAIVVVPFLAPCILFLLARGAFQGIRSCLSLRNFIGLRGRSVSLKGSALSRRAGFDGRKFNVAGTAVSTKAVPMTGVSPTAEDPSSDPSNLVRSNTHSAFMALPAFFTWLSFSTTAAALAGVLQDVGVRNWLLGTSGATLEDFSRLAPATIERALLAYEPTLNSGSVASAFKLANLTSVSFGLTQGLAQDWGSTSVKSTPLATSAAAAASVLVVSCAVTVVISNIGKILGARETENGVKSPIGSDWQVNRSMSFLCLSHIVSSGRNLACGLALAVSLSLETSTPTFVRASIASAFAFHALLFHVLTAAFAVRSLFLDLSQWVVSHAACGGLDVLSFTGGGSGQVSKGAHQSFAANLGRTIFPSVNPTPSTSLTLAQTAHLGRLHSLFAFLPCVTLLQAFCVVLGFKTRYFAQCSITGYLGLPQPNDCSEATCRGTSVMCDAASSGFTELSAGQTGAPVNPPQGVLAVESANGGGFKALPPVQPKKPQHIVYIEVGGRNGDFEAERDEKETSSSTFVSATLPPFTPRTRVKFSEALPLSLPPTPSTNLKAQEENFPALTHRPQPILVPIPDPSGRAPFILVPLLKGESVPSGVKDPPLPLS